MERYDLSSLRHVTQAGGAMPRETIRKLQSHLPSAQIYVMYGQTEATARLTYVPPARLMEKLGSVGIPIANVEIEVRGESGQPVPTGQTGEVFARVGTQVRRAFGKHLNMFRRLPWREKNVAVGDRLQRRNNPHDFRPARDGWL